jgi:hypothetical protein
MDAEEPEDFYFSIHSPDQKSDDEVRIIYDNEFDTSNIEYLVLGTFQRENWPALTMNERFSFHHDLEENWYRSFTCRLDIFSTNHPRSRKIPDLNVDILFNVMKSIIEPIPERSSDSWPKDLINSGLVCRMWWQVASSLLLANLFGKLGSYKYTPSSKFLLKHLKSEPSKNFRITSLSLFRWREVTKWFDEPIDPLPKRVSNDLVQVVEICSSVLTYLHIFNVHHSVGLDLCQALDNCLHIEYFCWDITPHESSIGSEGFSPPSFHVSRWLDSWNQLRFIFIFQITDPQNSSVSILDPSSVQTLDIRPRSSPIFHCLFGASSPTSVLSISERSSSFLNQAVQTTYLWIRNVKNLNWIEFHSALRHPSVTTQLKYLSLGDCSFQDLDLTTRNQKSDHAFQGLYESILNLKNLKGLSLIGDIAFDVLIREKHSRDRLELNRLEYISLVS